MKQLTCFILTILLATQVNAQGKWSISLNRKLLIATSTSNDSLNTKRVKLADWKSGSYLSVTYTESQPSGWHLALHFADETGNDLLVKDSTAVTKIPLRTARKVFYGKKEMKIYLAISPPNPMMEAPARMITLCILKLP